jgi:hypothetical protein
MENENEVLEVTKQEIRTISDKTQAMIYVIAGAIAMILGPILISGLFGWVFSLTGLIFVILGICGFIYISDDKKRSNKKD